MIQMQIKRKVKNSNAEKQVKNTDISGFIDLL